MGVLATSIKFWLLSFVTVMVVCCLSGHLELQFDMFYFLWQCKVYSSYFLILCMCLCGISGIPLSLSCTTTVSELLIQAYASVDYMF